MWRHSYLFVQTRYGKRLIMLKTFFVACFIFGFIPAEADESTIMARGRTSLCKEDEHVVLSATVQAFSVARTLSGPEKLVSLCADRAEEPFSKLVYRFGNIGAAEITVVATSNENFGLDSEAYGPHDGANVVWFKHGLYNYYISESTGQALG